MGFIKKYRENPRRMVLTFSFLTRAYLNRLGDLEHKNELANKDCSCNGGKAESECLFNEEAITNREDDIKLGRQVLEKERPIKAFKAYESIKEVETEKCKTLGVKKHLCGAVVCEKSYKMLLSDAVAGIFLVLCLCKLCSWLKRASK